AAVARRQTQATLDRCRLPFPIVWRSVGMCPFRETTPPQTPFIAARDYLPCLVTPTGVTALGGDARRCGKGIPFDSTLLGTNSQTVLRLFTINGEQAPERPTSVTAMRIQPTRSGPGPVKRGVIVCRFHRDRQLRHNSRVVGRPGRHSDSGPGVFR